MLKYTNMILNACAGYAKGYALTFQSRMMQGFRYWIMQEAFVTKSWDKYVFHKKCQKVNCRSIVGQCTIQAHGLPLKWIEWYQIRSIVIPNLLDPERWSKDDRYIYN